MPNNNDLLQQACVGNDFVYVLCQEWRIPKRNELFLDPDSKSIRCSHREGGSEPAWIVVEYGNDYVS